ncbi:MAG: ATP-binding cassette domain-containing protein [Proteobacteria bacterium]|nr:ATP-binding cassette domain-containing protein [Pseudomonadota bacterium]
MATLFTFKEESAAYGDKTVLSNFSFSIETGEKVALIGKSGSGKSTLLSLMQKQQTAGCALIPQDLGLVASLSSFHNTFMGKLDQHSRTYNFVNLVYPLSEEKRLVTELHRSLNLNDKLFVPVGELSGGEQQRVAIARALYAQRDILLGDEPVSSLDEHQSCDILNTIVTTHNTVVLALHDVDHALDYADRVIGLSNGSIALDSPACDLNRVDLIGLYQND